MPTPYSYLIKIVALTLVSYALVFSVDASADSLQKSVSASTTEYRYGQIYTPDTPLESASDSISTAKPGQLQVTPDSINEHAQWVSQNEYWIYDSWVTLENDIDHDGYYSQLTVEFDADSIFSHASVYAVIYIGQNNHYDSIHISSDFDIYGEDSSDSFTIQTTLISGFPPNDYDVLIELYDANSHTLVALTDGYDDADLAFLSLESENHEYRYEDTLVVVHEHAGSHSLISLLMLAIMVVVRNRFRARV